MDFSDYPISEAENKYDMTFLQGLTASWKLQLRSVRKKVPYSHGQFKKKKEFFEN